MNLTELLTTLEAPIVVRPTRRMTQGELESYLDKAADILRGNADHSEFRGYVFALLFYKRINDCYSGPTYASSSRKPTCCTAGCGTPGSRCRYGRTRCRLVGRVFDEEHNFAQ